jgi:hypothetical protein
VRLGGGRVHVMLLLLFAFTAVDMLLLIPSITALID